MRKSSMRREAVNIPAAHGCFSYPNPREASTVLPFCNGFDKRPLTKLHELRPTLSSTAVDQHRQECKHAGKELEEIRGPLTLRMHCRLNHVCGGHSLTTKSRQCRDGHSVGGTEQLFATALRTSAHNKRVGGGQVVFEEVKLTFATLEDCTRAKVQCAAGQPRAVGGRRQIFVVRPTR